MSIINGSWAVEGAELRSPAKPIAWLLLVCACAPKVVLGVGAPDVRVVLDVSAAMAQVDSHNMLSSAVAMLLKMLPENANAGVWTFAGRVNVLVEHATTDRSGPRSSNNLAAEIRCSHLVE